MATITQARIIKDTRAPGRSGMIIAEHIFDDGQIWPCLFEALANEDAQQRIDAMITDREAQHAINTQAQAEQNHAQSANQKIATYIKSLDDAALSIIGLSPSEIEVVKDTASNAVDEVIP